MWPENSAIKLEEVIPQAELQAWRDGIKKTVTNVPVEVCQFIDAMASKLGDFVQIKTYTTYYNGFDLLLANVKEVKGEPVKPFDAYPTDVPYMVAADHHAAMYRIFNRKGKQGLIDFCRAKVKGTELEKTLLILNVYVFKQERTEFARILAEINASKKLEE